LYERSELICVCIHTYNEIEHISIYGKLHSSVLDVISLRAADCDADHYLVLAKGRERLAVNKQKSTPI
jgi:hypothetical protein